MFYIVYKYFFCKDYRSNEMGQDEVDNKINKISDISYTGAEETWGMWRYCNCYWGNGFASF